MLKRILQAPPQETGAIDGYTSELSRLLRPALPSERADEIVGEAQAHLYDRADALVARENMSQAEAEARAVTAFTPAIQFAREMAQSAFEDARSKAWRTMGGATVLGLLCSVLALIVFADPFNTTLTLVSPITGAVYALLWLLICLCAYQARRAQTRQFALWSTLAAVFVFFYTGFYYLDGAPTDENWTQGNRTGIRRAYHYFRDERRNRQKDLARLKIGMQTFQARGNAAVAVPTERMGRGGTGYMVPAIYDSRHGGDAFPLGTQPTVSTLAEARARWQTDGPRWIARNKQVVSVSRHFEEPLLTALEQQGFAKTAWWYALVTAGCGAWIVALDWLFAKMGRANFTKRRARRIERA